MTVTGTIGEFTGHHAPTKSFDVTLHNPCSKSDYVTIVDPVETLSFNHTLGLGHTVFKSPHQDFFYQLKSPLSPTEDDPLNVTYCGNLQARIVNYEPAYARQFSTDADTLFSFEVKTLLSDKDKKLTCTTNETLTDVVVPARRLATEASKLEGQILQKTCLDYEISLVEYEKEIFKTYTVEVNILECPVDASDILLPYYDT